MDEQSDARERRSLAVLKWKILRRRLVIGSVIRSMHKSIPILLICLLGCNASSQHDADRIAQDANPPAPTNARKADLSIFKVPRPNSGKYSTDEATALLPQFLQRSMPIQKTHSIVTDWQSPTQGIRIHVTADDTVAIIDYFGRNLTGLDSVNDALDSTMTDGNERSVLVTSETSGWDSATKKTLIEMLFQPSVQIYLVGNDDG